MSPGPLVSPLAAGDQHACGVNSSGTVKCWGSNVNGQLGDGTFTDHHTPQPVIGLDSGVSWLNGGFVSNCAITPGRIQCWGNNDFGDLGDATTINRPTPVIVLGLGPGATTVSNGYLYACEIGPGGGPACWGSNNVGQFGNGTATSSLSPTPGFGMPSGALQIATGGEHACALLDGGTVECAGANVFGQLGDGTTVDRVSPVHVIGLPPGVVYVSASRAAHTCALTSAGAVWCWGSNVSGEVGSGIFAMNQPTPAPVSGLDSGAIALMTGGFHSCALMESGAVLCWGYNWHGEIGDGTTVQIRPTPVPVVGLDAGVVALVGGSYFTCALMETGGLKCWGENTSGQLGDGTTTDRLSPVDVIGF